MSQSDDNGSNKRQRVSNDTISIDDDIFDDLESRIIAVIFHIGLTQSSPKAIMDLMPEGHELTREHVKSHLQKYRIQLDKSREQFATYFETDLKPEFQAFLAEYGNSSAPKSLYPHSSDSEDAMLPSDVARFENVVAGDLATLQSELEVAYKEGGVVRKALNDAILQCSKSLSGSTVPYSP